jgi:hypothetical protein
MKTAAERLRAALDGAKARFEDAATAHRERAKVSLDHDFEHPEEDEPPSEADLLVEVSPLDVVELCRAVPKEKRTQIVRDLHKGSMGVVPELAQKPEHRVCIRADQAETLLKLQPAPLPAAPAAPPSEPAAVSPAVDVAPKPPEAAPPQQ